MISCFVKKFNNYEKVVDTRSTKCYHIAKMNLIQLAVRGENKMTINQMLKKIAIHNEVAKAADINSNKAVLRFFTEYNKWGVEVKDVKSFRKYIKEEFIDCFADAILNHTDWAFDEEVEITATDRWNHTHKGVCYFFVYIEY